MTTEDKAHESRLLTPAELAVLTRMFREMRHWSQEQLAELSGLNVRTIQRVEQAMPASLDTRRAIARAFEFEDIDVFSKPFSIPSDETIKAAKEKFERENVFVTLLRGLGPWKDSVYLVGGLTPRYLVAARPPVVPAHAGTLDVDIVIDLQILADTEAYHTMEDNFKKMGFERAENDAGKKLSWRWQARTEHGALMVLELLADAPDIAGGKVQPLPTEGTISALNIPHSAIVFDLHQITEIQAELLGGNGVATEKVKHANLVSFTCLKSFAFDQRFERKDAHDLIYCIEHAPEGSDAVADAFRKELAGKHGAVIQASLAILRNRFAQDEKTEGYRKDGPVSVAKFELGESDEPEQREARALRQRQASDVIDQLLGRIG